MSLLVKLFGHFIPNLRSTDVLSRIPIGREAFAGPCRSRPGRFVGRSWRMEDQIAVKFVITVRIQRCNLQSLFSFFSPKSHRSTRLGRHLRWHSRGIPNVSISRHLWCNRNGIGVMCCNVMCYKALARLRRKAKHCTEYLPVG